MKQLAWVTCGDDGHWCSFDNVDLTNVAAKGVYIIWHEGNPSRVVRIGQGDIKDRLTKHRADPEIIACKAYGQLRVTWASVTSASDRNGIEKYLADRWNPLVGVAFPDCLPIAVNSPW